MQKMQTVYLKDYKEPDYHIEKTSLLFDLFDDYTIVKAELYIKKINRQATSITLHGDELDLLELSLDNQKIDHF